METDKRKTKNITRTEKELNENQQKETSENNKCNNRHRFGHPHADVVERYQSVGSDIANTATSGAIRLVLEPGGVITTKARAATPFWIRKPETP